jgi:UDP-3-O-[3-hydroxymyristoyl] N-acetylglucosamine deacetylase
MPWQQTLQHKLTLSGVGLHTGQPAHCELLPAVADTGIVFVRTDLAGQPEIAATVDNLVGTTLATTLGVVHHGARAQVGTVEHLLCALHGLGVDNARVLIDGPEVPVLDGSALMWARAIHTAGVETLTTPRSYWRVRREVRVQDGRKWATISPHTGLRISCTLDFDHPLIDPLPYRYDAHPERFMRDIAPARTFCFRAEIDALKARGFARGGSLSNAIVIDGYQVLNPEGLRFPDEFVRHKVLDALGDLSLFGRRILAKLELHCSGHALNTALVQATLSDPGNVERVCLDGAGAKDPHHARAGFDCLGAVKGLA